MFALIAILTLSALFDLLNGMRDASNFVATIISSRVIPPRIALLLTAAAELAGPFIFGTAVARTFGRDLVSPGAISVHILLAALASALVWNLVTLWASIPSSSSHALLGGILGAVLAGAGPAGIQAHGLTKTLIALFISPPLGLLFGYLVTKLIFFLARNAPLRIVRFFKAGQVAAGVIMALSYGSNDAQKTMGTTTLALLTLGYLDHFQIPAWVILLSAGSIALGIAIGGTRMIRTLGNRFYKIHPAEGFCSQVASDTVILGAALLGGPVSTSQVVTSSILGVGAGVRASKVRWGAAGPIATAWLLTIPFCALAGTGFYWLFSAIFSSI